MPADKKGAAKAGAVLGKDDPIFEVNPLRSHRYIPENKWSVWVHDPSTRQFEKKSDSGIWSQPGFHLDPTLRTKSTELWLFYDDDPIGIEESVLRNNPQQGAWGFRKGVELQRRNKMERPIHEPKPQDIVIIPPGHDIPKNLQLQGLWIRPVLKRDVSALADGTTGFMQVSGQLQRKEKHSIGGAWKVLGNNDDMGKGRRKARDPQGDAEGNWQIYVRTVEGVRFPIQTIPATKISRCKERILEKKRIPIQEQRLTFEGTPLYDYKTVIGSGIRNGDTIDLNPKDKKSRTEVGKGTKKPVDDNKKQPSSGAPSNNKTPDKTPLKKDPTKKTPSYGDDDPDPANKPWDRSKKPASTKPISARPSDDSPEPGNKPRDRSMKPPFSKPSSGSPNDDDNAEPGKNPWNRSKKPSSSTPISRDPKGPKQNPEPGNQPWQRREEGPKPPEDSTNSVPAEDKPNPVNGGPKNGRDDPSRSIPGTKPTLQRPSNGRPSPAAKDEDSDCPPSKPTNKSPPKRNKSMPVPKPKDTTSQPLKGTRPSPSSNDPRPETPVLKPSGKKIPQRAKSMPSEKPGPSEGPNNEDRPTRPGRFIVKDPKEGRPLRFNHDPNNYDYPTLKDEVAKKINRPPRKFQIVNDDTGEPISEENPPAIGDTYSIRDMPPPQEITIKAPNGRNFTLLVDPEDSISDIKDKAAKPLGIPPNTIKLVDDKGDEPADTSKPRKSRTFYVEPPQVVVQGPDKKPNKLDVLPSDTCKDLIDKIRDKTGTKSRNFYVDDEPKPFPDKDTPALKSGLRHGTKLTFDDPPSITVQMPRGGRSFQLDVDPDDTTDDICRNLSKLVDAPVKAIRLADDDGELDAKAPIRPGRTFHLIPPEIEVKDKRGKPHKFSVLPHHTNEDLIQNIEEITGTKNRTFFFDGENPILKNKLPALKSGIGHGSIVEFEEPNEVEIKMPGSTRMFHLLVDPDDKPTDVKKQLAKLSDIPVKALRLVDENGEELDESKPVGTRVFTWAPPEIEVKDQRGKPHKIPVLPHHTNEDLIQNIEEITGTKNRTFFFDGENPILKNKSPALKSGIGHGSIVEFEEPNEVEIKMPGSTRMFHLLVDPDDKPTDIKKQLAKLSDIPVKALRLVDENGEDLDESRPVGTRVFTWAPPEIEIADTGGKPRKIEVMPNFTNRELIEKIKEATGAKTRQFFIDGDQENPIRSDGGVALKSGLEHGAKVSFADPPSITVDAPKIPGTRCFELVIDVDVDTADSVKSRIAKLSDLPVKELRLVDDEGIELVGTDRIRPGRSFHLDPPEVEVALPGTKKTKLEILPHHTLEDVQGIIAEESGIPVRRQRLFFLDSDEDRMPCESTKALKTNLKHGGTLSFQVEEIPEISFKTREGRTFILVIEPEETVKNVKERLRKKTNLMVGVFSLGDLDFDDVDEEAVFLDQKGIRPGVVLAAEPPKIEIELPGTTKKIKVAILPTTTMADIKDLIEETVPEYKAKKQGRMFFMDNRLNIDDNMPLLSKLDFDSGVQMEVRDFQLIVEHFDGSRVTLDVQTTDYIEDVKVQIEGRMGIPVAQQNIVHKGKAVKEDCTLKQQSIGPRSVLKLEPMKVYIYSPEGKKTAFVASLDDKFIVLKKKAAKKFKVERDLLCFMSGATEFFDSHSLSQHNVRHKHTIHAEMFRFYVMDILGEQTPMNGFKPSDTIAHLKQKISKLKTIPEASQLLAINGKMISDKGTIGSEGIIHRTVISVHDSTKVDLNLPESDQMKLKIIKAKKFKDQLEDIWPVVPDWKKRIFFFDNDENIGSGSVDVKVMHWTGEDFFLKDVKLGMTVAELKELFYTLKNIPVKKQKLTMNGKPLVDKRTLRQQLVRQNSIIVIEGKRESRIENPGFEKFHFGLGTLPAKLLSKMEVVIRHWQGYEFKVVIQPTEYLDDLRETIFDCEKIPVEQQRISFEGEVVSETESLEKLGITNGSLLCLEPMEVGIEMPSGEELHLAVEIDDSIRDIKKQIYELSGVPCGIQCLMFGGEQLLDSKTLAECEIEHEDLLTLEEFSLSVMHFSGKLFQLNGIKPSDTVDDIKSDLARISKMPKEKLRLQFQGKSLEKNKNLLDENIRHRSVLIMEEAHEVDNDIAPRSKISLFASAPSIEKSDWVFEVVHWNGETFTVSVNPNDYADDIREKLQQLTGIPLDDQRLTYKGTLIQDDVSLEGQGLAYDASLNLEPTKIVVETPEGKQIKLQVENDFTIRKVKAMIFDKLRIRSERQCLMLGGIELDDGKSINDYHIKHGDAISLEHFKIGIIESSGAKFDITEIDRNATLAQVKKEIAKTRSIPATSQVLSSQGNVLNDKKTLVEENVPHRTILLLEVQEKDPADAAPRPKVNLMCGDLSYHSSGDQDSKSTCTSEEPSKVVAKKMAALRTRATGSAATVCTDSGSTFTSFYKDGTPKKKMTKKKKATTSSPAMRSISSRNGINDPDTRLTKPPLKNLSQGSMKSPEGSTTTLLTRKTKTAVPKSS